jgi:hypothetical protein
VLAAAAKGWFLSDRRDQETGATPLYYDEHDLNRQRTYQIVCFMVGSDPAKFKSLADETNMPEARQERCKEEDYPKRRGLGILFSPLIAAQPINRRPRSTSSMAAPRGILKYSPGPFGRSKYWKP